jgi:hypothetical protein
MKPLLLRFRILFFLILLSNNLLFSQKKYEISAGLGYPDRINLRMKYGINTQAGISVGYWLFKDQWSHAHILTIGGDLYFHFPRKTTNKWYLNPGYTYTHWFQQDPDAENIMLSARVGRSLYFNNNMGINVDLGLTMYVYLNGDWVFQLKYIPPLPSGSISYFIKF